VNAYRNIHYFGMNIIEYEESLYSDFIGHLNREDVPCDRFLTSWNLLEDTQRSKFDVNELLESGCSVIESRAIKIQGRTGPVLMDSVKKLDLKKNSEQLLVEIPYDFYRILEETHVEERTVKRIPIEWRLATRKAFQVLFKRGYRVKDFYTVVRADRKRSFYVLSL
jgi:predicted GNAT superfamily acetyltransferase